MIVLAFLLAAGQTADAPPPKVEDKDNHMVCRRVSRTGSRMPSSRVCRTAFEWRVLEERAQREIGDLKRQSRMESMPSF